MDEQRVKEIAELEVRRYFEGYLRDVFPEQVKAMKHHTHVNIAAHDASETAHGGVEKRVNRFFWLLMGGATVLGGGFGVTFTKLSSLIG